MFNYGSNYLISGSVAPNRYTSTDPNIYNKWEQCTLFAGVAFFAQRITNVLTGKGLGEFGQAAGRKVLLAFALGGYFGSAFLYAIGYFAGAENRYPYPKVYDECISAANCAPDATVLKEPSLICESGTSTNVTQSIMRSCTEEAVEASKNHPDGHPTGAFFILSQGLCGLCAPIGASIYAFVRDVTKDDKAYRVAFGQSVGCGLLSGLLFGFIFGFIFYLGAPLPVFFVLTIFGGLLTGGVPALMACLVIKEPVKPEDRKPMLGKSGAKSVDWSPCHAFMIPFQINRYTACVFISLGLQALLGGMGEFTNVPYLLYALVRIAGIARKGGKSKVSNQNLLFNEAQEWTLIRKLLQLDCVISEVEEELLPNRLCGYLFELSQVFNRFYDQVPILKADETSRNSRLLLCSLTADTLKLGMHLLGIPTLDRM